mmetsp:Transcript_12640/g.33484  ORF Transcript_12640/g.33484 Transcript_12640/m.33484 type:complete len:244 (+) Transcript_12640:211-942(+)
MELSPGAHLRVHWDKAVMNLLLSLTKARHAWRVLHPSSFLLSLSPANLELRRGAAAASMAQVSSSHPPLLSSLQRVCLRCKWRMAQIQSRSPVGKCSKRLMCWQPLQMQQSLQCPPSKPEQEQEQWQPIQVQNLQVLLPRKMGRVRTHQMSTPARGHTWQCLGMRQATATRVVHRCQTGSLCCFLHVHASAPPRKRRAPAMPSRSGPSGCESSRKRSSLHAWLVQKKHARLLAASRRGGLRRF